MLPGGRISINEVMSEQTGQKKDFEVPQESLSGSHLPERTSKTWALPVLILVLVSFAVYFNALSGEFVYDDVLQIVKNPWIRAFSNIPTIFSSDVWSFGSLEGPGSPSNYYRPLMHVVFTLNYYLFGLKPWGFHLVNILLHCGVTVLVFLIIRTLLAPQLTSPGYFSPPFMAALLFAAHPVHTEVVTWIAGLPDAAFTLFYLLSFYLYIKSEQMTSGRYLSSVVCFAAAVFFKEPAVTLPAVLLAYDYFWRGRSLRLPDYLKRSLPYVLIGIGYLALRVHVLGNFAPHKRYEIWSVYDFAINVFPLFIQYLEKLIVPINLNAFYVFHPIHSLLELKGAFSLTVTLVFLGLSYVAFRKNKVVFLGILFLVVPLLPALYIPALGKNTFADRYLYLPSVGYIILTAISLSWVRERMPHATRTITILFLVIGALYVAGTITRNEIWHDNFRLWTDTVRKSPDSSIVRNYLGAAYASQGLFDKAAPEFEMAVSIDPQYEDAHNNLGVAFASLGQTDRAIFEYRSALWLDPDFAEAHYNLGFEYAAKDRFDSAIAEYKKALRTKPDYVDAHYNLGIAYASVGQTDMAIAEYREALRLNPDFDEARRHLNDLTAGRQ